jgi:hypothetical protein
LLRDHLRTGGGRSPSSSCPGCPVVRISIVAAVASVRSVDLARVLSPAASSSFGRPIILWAGYPRRLPGEGNERFSAERWILPRRHRKVLVKTNKNIHIFPSHRAVRSSCRVPCCLCNRLAVGLGSARLCSRACEAAMAMDKADAHASQLVKAGQARGTSSDRRVTLRPAAAVRTGWPWPAKAKAHQGTTVPR